MREIGELNWAHNQIKQADMEEEPHRIPVYDIGEFIEVVEELVWKRKLGKPMEIDRSIKEAASLLLSLPCILLLTLAYRAISHYMHHSDIPLHGQFSHSAFPQPDSKRNFRFPFCPANSLSTTRGMFLPSQTQRPRDYVLGDLHVNGERSQTLYARIISSSPRKGTNDRVLGTSDPDQKVTSPAPWRIYTSHPNGSSVKATIRSSIKSNWNFRGTC